MYNFVTEELIKKIPHVEGFTEELLIIGKTKCERYKKRNAIIRV